MASCNRSSRREFLGAGAGGAIMAMNHVSAGEKHRAGKARIAISLDLEMSRNFPNWEDREWDYAKGDLNEPTKEYSLEAARRVKQMGGIIHFFAVGRVFEQKNIDWLKEIVREGHPVGNHTYDHVHMKSQTIDGLQFRYQRAPWLVYNKRPIEIIRENIRMTNQALKLRLGIDSDGFRTPGGFSNGLDDRPDLQKLLLDLGFEWISSKYPSHPFGKPGEEPGEEVFAGIVKAQADAQPYVYPTGLIEIPMSPISDIGAFRTSRWKLAYFLEAIRRSVAWAIEKRAVFDFLCHPSCMYVKDPEFKAVKLICEMVQRAGDRAEVVGLGKIAAR